MNRKAFGRVFLGSCSRHSSQHVARTSNMTKLSLAGAQLTVTLSQIAGVFGNCILLIIKFPIFPTKTYRYICMYVMCIDIMKTNIPAKYKLWTMNTQQF